MMERLAIDLLALLRTSGITLIVYIRYPSYITVVALVPPYHNSKVNTC